MANSVVIGIVAFLLFLSIFWYVAGIGEPDPIRVTGIGTSWSTGEEAGTTMVVNLTFRNPHAFEITLTEVAYTLEVNEEVVAEGTAPADQAIRASGNGTAQILIPLAEDFLAKWWPQHVSNGEDTEVAISGEARVQVSQELRTASFETDWDWDTEWMGSWNDRVANCATTTSNLCLDSSTHEWRDDGGVDSVLHFQSRADGTIRIDDVSGGLLLRDETIAAGTVQPAAEMGQDETVEVPLSLALDERGLVLWWSDHTAACEVSTATYRLQVAYTLTTTETTGTGNNTTTTTETTEETEAWEFPVSVFQTQLACDV